MNIAYKGMLTIIIFAAVALFAGVAFVLIEYWKELAQRYSLDYYFVRAVVNLSIATAISFLALRRMIKKLVADWKWKSETLETPPAESFQRKDAIV